MTPIPTHAVIKNDAGEIIDAIVLESGLRPLPPVIVLEGAKRVLILRETQHQSYYVYAESSVFYP